MRVCGEPGCPEIYPKVEGQRCLEHRSQHERKRGSRQARGYDSEHDRLRRRWAPVVARGRTVCPKCEKPIEAHAKWDLGHTDDRTSYTGPEHAVCNRSAGGIKSHS